MREDTAQAGVELDIVREGITTVLAAAISGHGVLELPAGGVLLYGQWTGSMMVAGTLVVARGAVVKGNIQADKLYVDGTVGPGADGKRGQIVARELVVTDEGHLNGDIICATFACGKGSRVEGTIRSGT